MDLLGILGDDSQCRSRVDTPIQQEPALVIRNVSPFRRMVLLATGDVDDHLEIPEQDRTEGTGSVGDELSGTDDSWFMGKVLKRKVSVGR